MKVFISWSGELSQEIAKRLHRWLPSVIPSLDCYISSEDISTGARWFDTITNELQSTKFGIICLTKDNFQAPWLNFEAGALATQIKRPNLCPFLFNVNLSEVRGPLSQFQWFKFDKGAFFKLLNDINEKLDDEEKLPTTELGKMFELKWPNLQSSLSKIKKQEKSPQPGDGEKEKKIVKLKKKLLVLSVSLLLISFWVFYLPLTTLLDGNFIDRYQFSSNIENSNIYKVDIKSRGFQETDTTIMYEGYLVIKDIKNFDKVKYIQGDALLDDEAIENIIRMDLKGPDTRNETPSYLVWALHTKNTSLNDQTFLCSISMEYFEFRKKIEGPSEILYNSDSMKTLPVFDVWLKRPLDINGIEVVGDKLILLGYKGLIIIFNIDREKQILKKFDHFYVPQNLKESGWQSIDYFGKNKDDLLEFYACHSKKMTINKIVVDTLFSRSSFDVKELAKISLEDKYRWYEGCVIHKGIIYIPEARSGIIGCYQFNGTTLDDYKKDNDKKDNDKNKIGKEGTPYLEGVDIDHKNEVIYTSDRDGNIHWTSLKKFHSKNKTRDIWKTKSVGRIEHCQEISFDESDGGLWVASENEVLYLKKKFFYSMGLSPFEKILLFASITIFMVGIILLIRFFCIKKPCFDVK